MNPTRKPVLLAALCAVAHLFLFTGSALAAATLELFGNFNSMGVIVSLAPADDPNLNATTTVEYRATGAASYQPAFTASRVSDTRIATSLFWLSPDTSYDVRVTFSDPDGPPLNGVVLAGSGLTRAEVSIPAPTRTYHVTPAGSGTSCSIAAPCALRTAIGLGMAGEEIQLHGGTYYDGNLSLPRSGAAGAPIVLRGAPGETAVLDGADPATFSWTAMGGGVYHTTVNAADTNLVLSGGVRLYPYRSLADLQGLVWGISGFFASGLDLYVRLANNADPSGTAMVISRHVQSFGLGVNFIDFIDLTFRHYGLNPFPKAIYLNGASDCLIQGCTFAFNDLGIGLKRAAGRNVFQDNLFYDSTFLWPWDAVKAGSGLETGGIQFYSPTTGRGNVIRRNTFHDYFDGFSTCPGDTGGVTNETDVHDNLVYDAGDDGVSVDGSCSNVRLWRNTFHDVLVGISLAPVAPGPTYVVRNLVYRTDAGNNNYVGNCFKFNNGFGIPSGPTYLLHNTCDSVAASTPAWSLYDPGEAIYIQSRNNIFAGTREALNNVNPSYPLDLDWDDLYSPASPLVRWPTGTYATLPLFQSGTGQEPRGLSVAPGFSNAAAGDYTLGAASPLIDRGVVLPGINEGFSGVAPDTGAFERVTATAPILQVSACGVTDVCASGGPGNGNGQVEPGEQISLALSLSNPGSGPATNVQAMVTSSTPGVTLTQPNASFGTILPGSFAAGSQDIRYTVAAGVPCGTLLTLDVAISSDQGSFSGQCPAAVPSPCNVCATATCLVSGLTAPQPLRGIKTAAGASFGWFDDPVASEYHLNTVTSAAFLTNTDPNSPRQSPTGGGTLQCRSIPPFTGCEDTDALSDPARLLFYQVLSACGPAGADEGPVCPAGFTCP